MTPRIQEFLAEVDAFMAAPKILLGADRPSWQPGRQHNELVIKLPLEVAGEQEAGNFLYVASEPNSPSLTFRIGILFRDRMMCRLDFEEGIHPNTWGCPIEVLPPFVEGPHWHAWEINRHLVKSLVLYEKLRNARPFATIKRFDAALRWYCGERKIQLGAHGIELPTRTRLFE